MYPVPVSVFQCSSCVVCHKTTNPAKHTLQSPDQYHQIINSLATSFAIYATDVTSLDESFISQHAITSATTSHFVIKDLFKKTCLLNNVQNVSVVYIITIEQCLFLYKIRLPIFLFLSCIDIPPIQAISFMTGLKENSHFYVERSL